MEGGEESGTIVLIGKVGKDGCQGRPGRCLGGGAPTGAKPTGWQGVLVGAVDRESGVSLGEWVGWVRRPLRVMDAAEV